MNIKNLVADVIVTEMKSKEIKIIVTYYITKWLSRFTEHCTKLDINASKNDHRLTFKLQIV